MNLMNCLIWNCQGAVSKVFRRTLREMICVHKPSIIALVEPMTSGSQADNICKGFHYANWIRVEAIGFSWGIWIFWRENVSIDILLTYPQFILMSLKDTNSNVWFLSVVYGSPDSSLRCNLWETLNLKGGWALAICGRLQLCYFSGRSQLTGRLDHA